MTDIGIVAIAVVLACCFAGLADQWMWTRPCSCGYRAKCIETDYLMGALYWCPMCDHEWPCDCQRGG